MADKQQGRTLIACDLGKYLIKAEKIGEGRTSYRSLVYPLGENEQYDAAQGSKVITYDGKSYIIGAQGTMKDNTLDKSTELHKIGFMAAVSDLISSGESVYLVLGMPALLFRDKKAREDYAKFLTDGGTLRFENEGTKYTVVFADVFTMPESAGAVYQSPEVFADKLAAVVDIGGLNLNFSVYNNMALDVESPATVNYGVFTLHDYIRKVFGTHYNIVITDVILDSIVKNRCLKLNGETAPDSEELFNEVLRKFVSKLPGMIRDFGYDPAVFDTIAFAGGTSVVLGEKLIKETFKHGVLLKDAQWANTDGFLKAGALKFGFDLNRKGA